MRWYGIVCVSGALVALTAHARAQPSAEASDPTTTEARRHFKLGIGLYQDGNYLGALAEFEAAYQQKPGPGSLQNVALCQKALFRYRAAANTLAQLLAKHGSELSPEEQQTVHAAMDELRALVGSIVVLVEPSDAKVTIDGSPASDGELRDGVEVDIGEHTVTAEAPGYARLSRTLNVASGQKKLPLELKLKPTGGFLNVVAVDPKAAIAIDGETRAFHQWRGSVEPDSDHLVQVFRKGYDTFETTVSVALGKTVEVHADLGTPTDAAAIDKAPALAPGEMPKPPPRKSPRGFYGLLILGGSGLRHDPLGLSSANGTKPTLGSLGLRGGYRPFDRLAIELMLDAATVEIDNARTTGATELRHYTFSSTHFGPFARYLSPGKTVRFTGTAGFGIVHHELVLSAGTGTGETGGTSRAFDPYFAFEAGIQLSFGHLLTGAEASLLIDGVSNLNSDDRKIEQKRPFAGSGAITLPGIGLHVGYAFW